MLIPARPQKIGTARTTKLKARLEEFEGDLVDLRSVLLIQVSLSRDFQDRDQDIAEEIYPGNTLGDAYYNKVEYSVSTVLLKILLEISRNFQNMKKSR